jgi:carotenoid cleavage dioxygenase-like enzyme
MHDFYVTENYIIITCSIMTMKNSMLLSLLSPSFTGSVEMKESTNNVYLFFNKHTFEHDKSYELESDNLYVGHQEYAFEDNNGNVIVYRQVSKNIEYSPYNIASLKNIKKKEPFFNAQFLEKMTFNLKENTIEIQPYNFGSGFLCINQNFMEISKQKNNGLQYLYFNDMVISNGFESIVAIDIHNNNQIGIWKQKNFFVGEPQIIPDKKYPYDEKKTRIIFIKINRENNYSFLIICNYKLQTLKTQKIDTILNMGIHSSFY